MRIVTGTARYLAFTEAFRALQRLNDKSRLVETAIFIKSLTGNFIQRQRLVCQKKAAGARVISLPLGACRVQVGLHMALRADTYKLPVADLAECNRGIDWVLGVHASLLHGGDMFSRGTMAHLAIDSRFPENELIGATEAGAGIAKLTGVTDGAVYLVVGRIIQFFPAEWVGTLIARDVNDLPVIHPLLLDRAVLKWKDMNLSIWQCCGIGLLPFGTDGVIHRICVPLPVRLFDFKVVAAVLENHAGKGLAIGCWGNQELPVTICYSSPA